MSTIRHLASILAMIVDLRSSTRLFVACHQLLLEQRSHGLDTRCLRHDFGVDFVGSRHAIQSIQLLSQMNLEFAVRHRFDLCNIHCFPP